MAGDKYGRCFCGNCHNGRAICVADPWGPVKAIACAAILGVLIKVALLVLG